MFLFILKQILYLFYLGEAENFFDKLDAKTEAKNDMNSS